MGRSRVLALIGMSALSACGTALAIDLSGPAPTVSLNVASTNTSAYRGVTSDAHLLWGLTQEGTAVPTDGINGVVLDANGVLYTPGYGPLDSLTGASLPPGSLQVVDSGAPSISAKGDIYQWEGGVLHAYHSDRTSYWSVPLYSGSAGRGVRPAPNGNVYGHGLNGTVYVYSPSGTALWSLPSFPQVNSLPVFDSASNMYFDMGANTNGNMVSYDPQGHLRWSVPLTGLALSQIRLGPDGNVYNTEGGSTYVRDPSTGAVIRHFSTNPPGVQAIAPDGTLYTAFNQTVQALTSTGGVIWSTTLSSDQTSGVSRLVADSVGDVFCTTFDSQVMAFSPSGSLLWTVQLPESSTGSLQPIIGADGTIYARFGDNMFAIGGTVPSPGGALVLVLGVGVVCRRRR